MFCQKCGSEIMEGATFCQKCGAKTAAGEAQKQTVETYAGAVSQSAPMPKKKKSKKGIGIIIGIISIILIIIIVANSGGESVDYIGSVKQMAPYESSGISTTYGTVLDKYISECSWQERVQSDELAYVDASGKISDLDGEYDIAITFKITPYEGKSEGMLHMVPYALEVGERTGDEEAANNCVSELFDAYENGFETYADYCLSVSE